jgi:hypothetical protein
MRYSAEAACTGKGARLSTPLAQPVVAISMQVAVNALNTEGKTPLITHSFFEL